ncbi:MAG: SDR family oxidoreductase [Lactobacillus sp.]|jgi:3-oxoacyl-[acyl-carrier protein] reductase|nr:SDR family oxidoreductase [Lactobacillus sp.]
MKLGLKGKNAIVTGGATGLGKAIVLALTREGVNVAFSIHKSTSTVDELLTQINNEHKGIAYALNADLSDVDSTKKFFDEAHEKLGQIDILVNNAGIWLSGYVKEIEPSAWDLQLAINLRAPFLLCQKFANAAEKEGHGGHVLNVTSQAAYYGSTTGHAHYAASKAGLIAFNASFAREEAKKGINSNNICIGIMHTRMIEKNLEKDKNYYVNRIPIGRVAEPEEISQVAAFLVSDACSYMTGATIDATGGMLMH